jgi:hypothetical protein
MLLNAGMVSGDVLLMTRCMIEELLQVGLAPQELANMASDENYQALFAARHALGPPAFAELLEQTANRVGRHHFRTIEQANATQPVTLTVGRSPSAPQM